MIKEYKYRIEVSHRTSTETLFIPQVLPVYTNFLENLFLGHWRTFQKSAHVLKYDRFSNSRMVFDMVWVSFNSEEQARKFLEQFSSNPNEGYTPQQYHKAEQEKFQTKYIEI